MKTSPCDAPDVEAQHRMTLLRGVAGSSAHVLPVSKLMAGGALASQRRQPRPAQSLKEVVALAALESIRSPGSSS